MFFTDCVYKLSHNYFNICTYNTYLTSILYILYMYTGWKGTLRANYSIFCCCKIEGIFYLKGKSLWL